DAVHLPCAEVLLAEDTVNGTANTSELSTQFTPYVFVRFQFFRHGTQTSRLVAAPRIDSTLTKTTHGMVKDIEVSQSVEAELIKQNGIIDSKCTWTPETVTGSFVRLVGAIHAVVSCIMHYNRF
ncbi:unnamed protein product, partial [Echinostoma caproni]|uniref:VASt domain-containing protein n=1 Tax=Echinostoma caproni TaxID=27848 RepID=A0A183A1C3_9TREM